MYYSLPKVMIRLEGTYTEKLVTNYSGEPITILQVWSTNQVTTNIVSAGGMATNTFTSLTVRAAISNLNYTVESKKYYDIRLSEILIPDPDYIYTLKLKHQPQAADTFGLTVSTNTGFLMSLNVTNDDRTGAIIETIADTAIEVYKLAHGGFLAKNFDGKEKKFEVPQKIYIEFDPANTSEVDSLNKRLGDIAQIHITPPEIHGVSFTNTAIINDKNGVFYRPKQPYILELTNDYEITRKVILIPNKAPILSINLKRAPFVKQTSQITFVDGFPTQLNIDRPSELEAIVKVPYNIVKSVATIPTNLIQLKIDYSSANQRLYDAQKKEIDSLTNLMAAQQRLIQMQSTNMQTSTNR